MGPMEASQIPNEMAPKIPLSWKTPDGWEEIAGTGMRLVTFKGDGVESSIVSLGGAAGGIPSNVIRWMGQINMAVPSESELNAFIESQEKLVSSGKLEMTLINLAQLQGSQPDSVPSMMASMIQLDDTTVFIKMTGTKAAITKNHDEFKDLCNSLQLKNHHE